MQVSVTNKSNVEVLNFQLHAIACTTTFIDNLLPGETKVSWVDTIFCGWGLYRGLFSEVDPNNPNNVTDYQPDNWCNMGPGANKNAVISGTSQNLVFQWTDC